MPSSTVHWRDDGSPWSPRFGDIYRSAGVDGQGAPAQARGVFLHGCGLLPDDGHPAAWAGAERWQVLETGFGLGLNFLATWLAWRQDPARPQRLFYSAVEAFPPEAGDLLRSAAPFADLVPLAQALVAQWHGLLPGLHRLSLDGDRVQLTLAVGDVQPMLAELSGRFDSLFLDGFSPDRNPDMWRLHTLKAAARLLRRGTRAATWCVATGVRERLAACGFQVERVPGLPPKRHALRATYAPRWEPKQRARAPAPAVDAPARCAVVGGGLAGAAAAYALAQRGWRVIVLDRAPEPAAGASGLPAGLVAPHVSPDDRPLSRLSRAGVRATLTRARTLLREGQDFAVTGVLERHAPGERRLPPAGPNAIETEAARADSAPARAEKALQAGVPFDADHPALWHRHAGWIRPAALVRAMLAAPGIEWRGGQAAARIVPGANGHAWRVLDASAAALVEAELVVIAAGFDSLALLQTHAGDRLPLHGVRGQAPVDGAALPGFPVNGHGSLIAHVPWGDSDANPDADAAAAFWVTGATFERGSAAPALLATDHAANRQRLAELLPHAAAQLGPQWDDRRAQAWAAVRATLPDRLPAVGAWDVGATNENDSNRAPALDGQAPTAIDSVANSSSPRLPLQLLTGLGARGLTLSVLCGEIAAAALHGEPLPVERTLAARLGAGRWLARGAPTDDG